VASEIKSIQSSSGKDTTVTVEVSKGGKTTTTTTKK